LCQGNYAKRILDKGGLADCNPYAIPMESRLKLQKESNSALVGATEYRSLVGSLRYLINTRPDLAFAVGYVSRYMEGPHEDPREEGSAKLISYSDSDLVGDLDSRKNTSGVLFFLGDSPVSWQSSKQRVVALSSCEAEYIAAATRACEGVWLACLLSEMMNTEVSVPMLRIDNKSALSLIKNPVHHDRSKLIDVRFHLIREYANMVRLKWSSSELRSSSET
jgi:hypothetical protein